MSAGWRRATSHVADLLFMLRLLLDSSRLLFRVPVWTGSPQPPRGVAELSQATGTYVSKGWDIWFWAPPGLSGRFDTLSPHMSPQGLIHCPRIRGHMGRCLGVVGRFPFLLAARTSCCIRLPRKPRDSISLGFGDSGGVSIPGTCHRVRGSQRGGGSPWISWILWSVVSDQ